jgi:hypothetical protein
VSVAIAPPLDWHIPMIRALRARTGSVPTEGTSELDVGGAAATLRMKHYYAACEYPLINPSMIFARRIRATGETKKGAARWPLRWVAVGGGPGLPVPVAVRDVGGTACMSWTGRVASDFDCRSVIRSRSDDGPDFNFRQAGALG